MTVSPWLVLAGALLGAGLGAILLGHLDTRQHHAEDEQAQLDDQFAQLIAHIEEPQP
ncbi:hypothetical protein ACGF0D_10590 [Kitasatospora sp. NPDC048298]|uniref:hypothetical protein n=1 Tax=Kitasatospora sp. NPDC048298 TaxID=3364049 RepID=UPI0037132B16